MYSSLIILISSRITAPPAFKNFPFNRCVFFLVISKIGSQKTILQKCNIFRDGQIFWIRIYSFIFLTILNPSALETRDLSTPHKPYNTIFKYLFQFMLFVCFQFIQMLPHHCSYVFLIELSLYLLQAAYFYF